MNNDKINEYIYAHPRESLQLFVILIFVIWQSTIAVFGVFLYLILRHFKFLNWWMVLLAGILVSLLIILFQWYYFDIGFPKFLCNGFILNIFLWKTLFTSGFNSFLTIFTYKILSYIIGFSFILAGILDLINLIPNKPHHEAMQELQNGLYRNTSSEITNEALDRAFKKQNKKLIDGIVLGISKYSGKDVVIPDRNINQVLLVLGTTGSGKTITLRRFYKRAITKGYPLIIVDGKPDEENIGWLQTLSKQFGRRFIGFNCGNYLPYDPLANGGFTELKDKIISLKDEWSNDYFRSIAEDYLQTTLEVLIKSAKPFDLRTVVNCLNFDDLAILARETKDSTLMKRVSSLEHYDRKDITGLQAHLNILIHSELGQYFEKNETTFTLPEILDQNAVVYFSLPALRFPSFSKVLGKLVINDLKAVIDRRKSSNQRIFTVFDEFSVFAGEQVLNLVNMGRGKGIHAVFGTQGLADLDKVDVAFKDQILNCVNTIICHRLNDQESAEGIANWVGTKDAFNVTAQLNIKQGDAGMGTVRINREFTIHPDDIKQGLQTGEAFYISKIGKFAKDKVKITFE